uniref:BTB domain-containing protein n=1 Tax=Graphocephala atropunctata TaxID=36148 RepID=A0A1B6LLC2_9HEMI
MDCKKDLPIVKDAVDEVLDPAEYLFNKTKFYDHIVMIGDPCFDGEKFSIVSSHLAAHSTVFRDMLLNSTGSHTYIGDVSPRTFKLMLRHVYGGHLDISGDEAVELVLCAHKYNMRSLLARMCKRLIPTGVEDVFAALSCVTFGSCPTLLPSVTKIIQEQTDKVVLSEKFLLLDEKDVEFISASDILAITEVDLWRHLVRWGKHQALPPGMPVRLNLTKPLKNIRLASMSYEDIIKVVMPSNILTSTELMQLLTAIADNKSFDSPGLCSTLEKRGLHLEESKKKTPNCEVPLDLKEVTSLKSGCVFKSEVSGTWRATDYFSELPEYQTSSNFTIKVCKKDLQLQSFTCRSKTRSKNYNKQLYQFECSIEIYEYIAGGFCRCLETVRVVGSVVCDDLVVIPLTLKNGQLLTLKANSSYYFELEFSTPHPLYKTGYYHYVYDGRRDTDTTNVKKGSQEHMAITFNDALHVQQIDYTVL